MEQKSQKKFKPVLITILGLIIGLIIGYCIAFVIHKPQTNQQPKQKEKTNKIIKQSAIINDQIYHIFNDLTTKNQNFMTFNHNFNGAISRANNKQYYIQTSGYSIINRYQLSSKDGQELKQELEQKLKSYNLKKVDHITLNENNNYLFYRNDQTSCVINEINKQNCILSLQCSDNQYIKTMEAKLAQFYDLIDQPTKNLLEQAPNNLIIDLSVNNFNPGQTKNYHLGSISVSYFNHTQQYGQTIYQTPDQNWHIFTTKNNQPAQTCDDYSQDAQKAYFDNGKCTAEQLKRMKLSD